MMIRHEIQINTQMEKKEETGNIKVFCRFRPFNQRQKQNDPNPRRLHRINNKNQLIINKDGRGEEISFIFDNVFDLQSTQQQVFERVGKPVLDSIRNGYNGTIMAYGQTSSGKTHTMQGYDVNEKENRGIMPRMIEQLFNDIQKSPDWVEYKLKISIFQLYNEKIRDLLDVSKNDLKIRENKKTGNFVEHLTDCYVSDKHQLFRIINYGQKNRAVCSTNMNDSSSRSHLIFLLAVNQFNKTDNSSKNSKLYLIDLAGSEKISKTGAQGKALEQAKNINISLTNLGIVIKALTEKTSKGGFVPYRNSKLTSILKDSLGGNSKTTLIVTCSPHLVHQPQTLSTLRFGENAQKIKNKPTINREPTIQQLQKKIQKMEAVSETQQLKIKILQQYITLTLGAKLPNMTALKPKQVIETTNINQKEKQDNNQNEMTSQSSELTTITDFFPSLNTSQINDEAEKRVKSLQLQLQRNQAEMREEMNKHYELKKQYHQLHQNLTDLIKVNFTLEEQLQEKTRRSLLSDKSLHNNAHLIRLILGQIMTLLGNQKQQQLQKNLIQSYWYQQIMVEGISCSEYWQIQKDEMNRQLQELMSESRNQEDMEDSKRKTQEERALKDNEKILDLQRKFDDMLEEYNQMMSLQTTWKAQCQLYERKLKKKEETIQNLERKLEELEEQVNQLAYEDHDDDIISVRSKIVKPLKGGSFPFR